MTLSRRAFLASSAAFVIPMAAWSDGDARPFSHDYVVEAARRLAAEPYRARQMVPEDWRNLTYEQYRSLWFRPTEAL